jgi:hypothetical protein
VAGQLITERLTQLTLRTFHESGKATITTDPEILSFFENHLIEVETYFNESSGENTKLTFDTTEIPDKLINENYSIINGLVEMGNNYLIYESDFSDVANKDVISVVKQVKEILMQCKVYSNVEKYYIDLMTAILEVGVIYSSFVEILFANMFLADYDNKIFWRYRQDLKPTFKLGDRMMAAYISSRIGLLFQPNKNTIEQIDLTTLRNSEDDEDLTIYEKIYLGKV